MSRIFNELEGQIEIIQSLAKELEIYVGRRQARIEARSEPGYDNRDLTDKDINDTYHIINKIATDLGLISQKVLHTNMEAHLIEMGLLMEVSGKLMDGESNKGYIRMSNYESEI